MKNTLTFLSSLLGTLNPLVPGAQALRCPAAEGKTFAASNGDKYEIECYVDRAGGDIAGSGFYVASLNDCIDKCSVTANCVDVSYVSTGSAGACYLKSSLGKARFNEAVWGAQLISKPTSSSSKILSTTSSKTSSISSSKTSSISSSKVLSISSSKISSTSSSKASSASSSKISSASSSKISSASSSKASSTSSSKVSSTSSSKVSLSTSSSLSKTSSPSLSKASSSQVSSSASASSKVSLSSTPSSSVSSNSVHTISSSTSSVVPSSSSGSISSGLTTSSLSSVSSNTTSSAASSGSSSIPSSSSTILIVVSSNSSSASSSTIPSTTSSSSSIISSAASISSNSTTVSGSPTSSGNATLTSSSSFSTITTSASLTPSASANSTTTTSANTTSTTCSSMPTFSAGTLPNCVPCQGQPGNDQFCGFDINTDYYTNTPITCKVVTYTFDITNTTISPDGIERLGLLVNGQMPGPTIQASWGDTVVVTVNNHMQNNGTSIHFHGVRQLNTNEMDGVPSITQCPIAPGSSMTYTWVATNYGTSWYHSHFAIQTWEGVFGPVVIDGPKSASFDVDAGTFMLQDWSHATVDSLYDLAQNATPIPGGNGTTFGGPVLLDTGLINGKNTWGPDGSANQTGERLEVTWQPGQSYLLHVINAAIQSSFAFYIDGHVLTVISNDFVPIVPYQTDILHINIGQRYEVIVTTNQTAGNYWMRADVQSDCSGVTQGTDIKAIVQYSNSPTTGNPNSTAYNYTVECVDEPYASLVPVLPLNTGAANFTEGTLDVVVQANAVNLFKWYLSGTTFFSQYDEPTLLDIYQNDTTPDFSGNLLVDVPDRGEVVYVIVESAIPLPHPLHLHGHDFTVLASGSGSYSSSVALNLNNPPRRDTALLPAAGYIVLAFETDNPGVWLMHCHIGWHTSMGFALQFVEIQEEIATSGALNNSCTLTGTCASWSTYANANDIVVEDSGV